jgi:uncharacterized protein (TIGR02246 family)
MSKPAANVQSEIEQIIEQFVKAANAKDVNTMASLYAEDATLLPPGQPAIKGRNNIRDYWQGFLAAGASDPVLKIVSVETSGDLAYEIGQWTANMPAPDGGSARAAGKYLVVYRRQQDGSLKMVADMFSANS